MMITPEMMEQLGGKRGKARGPDMTNREVSEAEASDEFAGAETLDDALGDWHGDGRWKRRLKKKPQRKDVAYERFVAANDRLEGMVGALTAHVVGLRAFCDGQAALSDSLVEALGDFEGVPVREYQAASARWCRTSRVPHADSSLHSLLEVGLETKVIDPIAAHLDVRRNLQAQLSAAKGPEERGPLLDEIELFSDSMAAVMAGPLAALRTSQAGFLATAAAALSGEAPEPEPEPEAQPEPEDPAAAQVAAAAVAAAAKAAAAGPPIWGAFAPDAGWPLPSPLPPSPSPSPCLLVLAAFGWEGGRRVLHVTLRNASDVEISAVQLQLLCAPAAGAAPLAVGVGPLPLESLAPQAEARHSVAVWLGTAEPQPQGSLSPPPVSPQPQPPGADDDFDSFFGERDGQTTPGFTFSKPESPATSDGDATPRTAEDIALDATAVTNQPAGTILLSYLCPLVAQAAPSRFLVG